MRYDTYRDLSMLAGGEISVAIILQVTLGVIYV